MAVKVTIWAVPIAEATAALTRPCGDDLPSRHAFRELEVAVAAHMQSLNPANHVSVRVPVDAAQQDAFLRALNWADLDGHEGPPPPGEDWFSRYLTAERTFRHAGQHLAATGAVSVIDDGVISRDGRCRTFTRFAAHLDCPDLNASVKRVGFWAESSVLTPDEALVRGVPYFSAARHVAGQQPWVVAALGRHRRVMVHVPTDGPDVSAADSCAWMAAARRLDRVEIATTRLPTVTVLTHAEFPALSGSLPAHPQFWQTAGEVDGALLHEAGAVTVGATGTLRAVQRRFSAPSVLLTYEELTGPLAMFRG